MPQEVQRKANFLSFTYFLVKSASPVESFNQRSLEALIQVSKRQTDPRELAVDSGGSSG